jgi:hypothetical protein
MLICSVLRKVMMGLIAVLGVCLLSGCPIYTKTGTKLAGDFCERDDQSSAT